MMNYKVRLQKSEEGYSISCPGLPGDNHLDAVRALEKAGFRIIRQGKHIVMSDGVRIVTVPRHNPVNAFTMGGIARDAGLSVEDFKKLL